MFLNKYFEDIEYLLTATTKTFDVIAVSELRILKDSYLSKIINTCNYSVEFTPTESHAGEMWNLALHWQQIIL